jgi:ABC-type multidrug transport system fused ATPase/permease subunit
MISDPSKPRSYLRKLYALMEPDQRRQARWLLFFMVIGMMLEALGVGFIVPALGAMTTPDIAAKYPALAPWLAAAGHPSQVQLVIAGMLALIAIYAVKAAFLIFVAWYQSKFVFALLAILSQRLFATYLRQPYTFHLQRNSAELMRNMTVEMNFFSNAAQSAMMVFSEAMVMAGIVVLIFAIEPEASLVVCMLLGGAGWLFQKLIRSRITRWGTTRQRHNGLMLQHLQQGLGSIKDIKVLGREEDFLGLFRKHNLGYIGAVRRQYFTQQIPRMWLELMAVTGLAVAVFIMIGRGMSPASLLPTIGLFGAAAFRLIPSMNRSMVALQATRFGRPVIEMLYRELIENAPPPGVPRNGEMPFRHALGIEHVTFAYDNTDSTALQGIDLVIPHGACVGFVGGSGAGKSSLIDVILGVLTPQQGRITVDGADIAANLRGWQEHIGYVPQTIFLTDDTLRRNIAFGLADAAIDDTAVQRALRDAQLDEFVSNLPEGLETMVGERGVRLSGGQRQRIGIARALYHDPDVLVLDEATSALDTQTEGGVMGAIRLMQGKKTILIVAHRLSTVEYCDMLVKFEKGRVTQIAASLREIYPDPAIQEA